MIRQVRGLSYKRHTISITYPQDFESLFRKIIETSAMPPANPDDLFAIELSLGEAVSNALIHGNQRSPEKHVTIEYGFHDGVFDVTITDEGHGFNSADVPDPVNDDNLTKDHGRGVMLMEHYMDKVHFNKRGNQVRMLKRIAPLTN